MRRTPIQYQGLGLKVGAFFGVLAVEGNLFITTFGRLEKNHPEQQCGLQGGSLIYHSPAAERIICRNSHTVGGPSM